ncbi:MAG: serine acetyltransferase [Clostridiales bacterium]|nr:serine acetyltransferase [Clostridiales bacterium]
MGQYIDPKIGQVVDLILSDYEDERTVNRIDIHNQPDKAAVIDVVEKLLKILYPGFYSDKIYKIYSLKNNMSATIEDVIYHLKKQIAIVLKYNENNEEAAEEELDEKAGDITLAFMKKIPEIRAVLETDIDAAFEGDPAAKSKAEIIFSYPGLYAISVYRVAHELEVLHVPMIPRMMTEHAHSITGIDIHPGAQIGKYFFIDHGTGIVIGETTIIGEHVKIYQGVTLGGLSTRGGQKLSGVKRHPTIGNNVTIYSGASILGGETVIGDDVTVGGNTFLVNSVDGGTLVSAKKQELKYSNKRAHKKPSDKDKTGK